jgi:hypothetical protein
MWGYMATTLPGPSSAPQASQSHASFTCRYLPTTCSAVAVRGLGLSGLMRQSGPRGWSMQAVGAQVLSRDHHLLARGTHGSFPCKTVTVKTTTLYFYCLATFAPRRRPSRCRDRRTQEHLQSTVLANLWSQLHGNGLVPPVEYYAVGKGRSKTHTNKLRAKHSGK